ncbi:MAG: hypothetical protein Q9213_002609 [Squamulea squamosa]
MGRVAESRQLSGYRDDGTVSTSSAVLLQDQAYADEAPPAYTDDPDPDPDPVDTHGHGSIHRKSVGGRVPRRFIEDHEAQNDPGLEQARRMQQERERLLKGVQWTLSTNQDAKGSTTTYISETLSSDPAACQAFIETSAQESIQPVVRLIGTHSETRRRDKKDETTHVTDFDISVPLGGLLVREWARTKIVENSQKAYRGGIRKQLDPRVNAHSEAAATAPSLQEWCHRFCASSASAKSFTISRTVTELQRHIITKSMTEALRGTDYRGNIATTYPICNRATIIVSDHWINRYRHNKFIWWICVILQLWIFTWPLIWFMTKRWEVFTVEWPCRIYMQPDGSWPMAHEFYPHAWSHEGQQTNDSSIRVAHQTEEQWVGLWRLAVQQAAESKRCGTLSDADRRIAEEVEARSRQRPAGRTVDGGVLAAATGLLSGVMMGSQRTSGWGGDLVIVQSSKNTMSPCTHMFATSHIQGSTERTRHCDENKPRDYIPLRSANIYSRVNYTLGFGDEKSPHSDRTMTSRGLHVGVFSTSQLLVSALICYVVYYICWQLTVGARHRRMIKRHGCEPIKNTSELNPWKDSLFGWTQLLLNSKKATQHRLLDYSRERYLRHGHTIHFKLGFNDIVFTIEPENLKAMLATKFNDWNLPDRRKAAFDPLLGRGIFTSDGGAWQHSRELLRPNFVRNQVADLAMFESHIEHLIQAIPQDGSTVELKELFFRLTIDSATEFLFGESTNCLAPGASSEYAREFANAFDRSQEAAGFASRDLPIAAKLFTRSSIGKDIRYVHKFVDHYVQLGLESQKKRDVEKSASKSDERYVFLFELVKATQDPIRLRSELLNVLLAGRDTTASLLTNVWFMLAKRPDVWTKLRREVDALSGEQPTFEQIKNMKYLKYVLNENTVLPRGGGPDGTSPLFLPAKSTVGWSLYAMHRREDLFGKDAEDFKPERWETLRPGWEYLPFNGGPRICIGQQFALTEASYTTIRLMQVYKEIESRDPEPWTECITITASGRATKVALTPA